MSFKHYLIDENTRLTKKLEELQIRVSGLNSLQELLELQREEWDSRVLETGL